MLVQVVTEALAAQPAEDRDTATAALALAYAREIDSDGDLTRLGPALLATLEALHMSPRARNAAKKAVTDDKPANPIDDLAARRAGLGNPPAIHATTA